MQVELCLAGHSLFADTEPEVRHPHAAQSFKYVNYSNLKNFSSDFKVEYNAPNETFALYAISN